MLRPRPRHVALGGDDREFLRRVARRTWHFFDHFTTAEDHGLPPDNVQETPARQVAHRTSPTNIGMALLSTLAARDLGYLRSPEFAARMRTVLGTIESLERHEGHLFNWYDTLTLEPLRPRYVSTVDSGNLAASLIALSEGLRPIATKVAMVSMLESLKVTTKGSAATPGLRTRRREIPSNPSRPCKRESFSISRLSCAKYLTLPNTGSSLTGM